MALALTRKVNDELVFQYESTGEEFMRIKIVRISPNATRVLIQAGDEIRIMRAELIDGDIEDDPDPEN